MSLIIVVIVLVILLAGASYFAYSFNSTSTDLNSKIASQNTQISQLQSQIQSLTQTKNSLQTQVTQLQAQISSLQSSNSTLTSQVASLQAQVSSLQSTISGLQSQITSLQAQLASLQAAYIVGDFTWKNSCPLFGNCNYLADGSFANVGSNTAHSVTITFTFYSGASQTGQVLCTANYVAGDVAGRTVHTMPEVTCSGSSSTSAVSASVQFSYT